LVQCDDEESFYRFPGGSVEFGETVAEAIQREFAEEFDLSPVIGGLRAVAEERFSYGGQEYHQVTLLHEAQITGNVPDEFRHKEYTDVKLVWRTMSDLESKPVVPHGILNVLKNPSDTLFHLRNGFDVSHQDSKQ
jgi:8-oxo-dGTP diphosphatase